MELRHLRYFVAVAEELHFGRAAKRLRIAQPPLSLQIRQLEEEIGVQLFHRTKRRVLLTDAGRAFLQEARKTLAQVQRAVQVAQQTGRGEVGALSIGFINAAIYSLLPEILRIFRTRFPQVALTLHELTTEEQVVDLLEGRIDIGFLRPPIRADNLNSMVVLREPFVVALPEAHPLAEQAEIPLRELADAAFLMATRHHGPSLYDQIISLCQKAGFTPKVVQEADRMQTIVGLVAAGIGVALVPGSMQHLKRAGVVYRPIKHSDSTLEIAIAWRKDDPSPCLRTLLEVVSETRATQTA